MPWTSEGARIKTKVHCRAIVKILEPVPFKNFARHEVSCMRRPILFIFSIMFVVIYCLSIDGTSTQVWILPGAAETVGLFGARFSSTLYITNNGDTSAAVQISFIPYAEKFVPTPASLTVVAGGTVRVDHCLQTLFGLAADAGTLTLESTSSLVNWMSTANIADPEGSYGLALRPLSTTTLLDAGSRGDAIWVSQDSHYRTNLALLLLDSNTSVKVSVYDDSAHVAARWAKSERCASSKTSATEGCQTT